MIEKVPLLINGGRHLSPKMEDVVRVHSNKYIYDKADNSPFIVNNSLNLVNNYNFVSTKNKLELNIIEEKSSLENLEENFYLDPFLLKVKQNYSELRRKSEPIRCAFYNRGFDVLRRLSSFNDINRTIADVDFNGTTDWKELKLRYGQRSQIKVRISDEFGKRIKSSFDYSFELEYSSSDEESFYENVKFCKKCGHNSLKF